MSDEDVRERNERVALRFFDALGKLDFDTMVELCDDRCVFEFPFRPAVIHGTRSFRRHVVPELQSFVRSVPFSDVVVEQMLDPNSLVLTGNGDMTMTTGERFGKAYCWQLRFRDGRISFVREFDDRGEIRERADDHL